jgi:type II secretion system protein J
MNARFSQISGAKERISVRPIRAFTLIEVMVAMTVFSLVMVSLYSTWRIISQSTGAALKLTARAQRTRIATQSIESALMGAQLFQGNAPLYSFLVDTSGKYSAISFATIVSDGFPGSGFFQGERLRRVTFTVENEGELVLRQNSLLAPSEGDFETHPVVLAREVSAFQLEFWDLQRGEYVPEWLFTNRLPQVVRVTLGIGQEGRYSKQPLQRVTRVIRIPSSAVASALQGQPLPGSPPPVQPLR